MAHANGEGKQPVIRTTSVIATGLASAGAAFLTARFGIAGTVLGTAVMVMLLTAGSPIIEVFLEAAANRVRAIPGVLLARVGRGAHGVEAAPAAVGSHGPGGLPGSFVPRSAARRKSLLTGAAAAAAASFLIGMGVVTGVEMSVGKSLSCWVWGQCPVQNPEERAGLERQTRPSFLGGQAVPESASKAHSAGEKQPEYPRPVGPLAPSPQGETPAASQVLEEMPPQNNAAPEPSSEASRTPVPQPRVSQQTAAHSESAGQLSAPPIKKPDPVENLPDSLQQPVRPGADKGWTVPEGPAFPEPGR